MLWSSSHGCFGLTVFWTLLALRASQAFVPFSSSSAFLSQPQTIRYTGSFSSKSDDDNGIYDLAIVGAGVVGVQAALLAAQGSAKESTRKPRVILIDAPRASAALLNEVTGDDLSLGAPSGLFSKALRDTGKRIKVSTLRGMGLREDSVWNEIMSSCLDLAQSNADDIRRVLSQANVTFLEGFARFPDSGEPDCLVVHPDASSVFDDSATVQLIHSRKILLATGSKPFRPSGIPFDGKRVFDSDSINALKFLPKSIAITGSGIVAMEFAKIFRTLGADVTLIIRDQVPRNALQKIGLDKDVSAMLVADLIRSGIHIQKGAQVKKCRVPEPTSNSNKGGSIRVPIKLELEAKGGGSLPTGALTELSCDIYLAAVGRTPNTAGLNLNAGGVEVDDYGGVVVNGNLQTTQPNVYAAGDVVGRPFLASTGVAQAQAAMSVLFGSERTSTRFECDIDDPMCVEGGVGSVGMSFDPASLASNPFAFPTGVWTSPEAAYYGLSTTQALEMGVNASEGMALYAECLRGRVFSPNGLLKLVYDQATGRILGVHICGEDACELIHYGMELVRAKRTIQDLLGSLYSAVTFHELYKIAAEAAMDEKGARARRAAAGKALAARNRQLAQAERQ